MCIKRIQDSKFKVERETSFENSKKNFSCMPLIECKCGTKILVVPDIAAMDRAIKSHLTTHKEADERFLIKQILDATAR